MKNLRARLATGERGATLLVAMVMLVLLTLFVIAAVNMNSMNMRVMGNTQVRNEAVTAGQRAIEQVVSTNFPDAPPPPSTMNIDINGDGTADYTVAIATPVCLNSVPVKLAELDATNPNDIACYGSGVIPNPGVPGGGTANSYCSSTQWDVNAVVTDAVNPGAAVTVHQGIGKRVVVGTPC